MPDRGEAWQLTSRGAPGATGGGVTDGAGATGAVEGATTAGGFATAGVSVLRDGESQAPTASAHAPMTSRRLTELFKEIGTQRRPWVRP